MSRKNSKQTPKRVLRLPDLDFAKSAVLNTLSSPSRFDLFDSRSTILQPGTAGSLGSPSSRRRGFATGLNWNLGGYPCPIPRSHKPICTRVLTQFNHNEWHRVSFFLPKVVTNHGLADIRYAMRMSEIYTEHAPAVYRCLLAWTRSAALAEELTAETFYRAIVADQQVRAATARGYLIAIARNEWRKRCANRSREQPLVIDFPAPAQSGEALMDFQLMLAALADLPDELREPLVLYAQGGLSYEEIAAQLNITLATVKIRIHRARQRLEKHR